jgi:gliding motility-associated-like protein
MLCKKLAVFLLIISFPCKVLPAVFVVTSNADAGPGTFRDALTQAAANGSATKDYINFNLPDISTSGRTITILSPLPGVSSNLVIDGSTQPGAVFGVSTAKVCMLFDSGGQAVFSGLAIQNQSDVEIYGLYLRLTNSFDPRSAKPIGIHIIGTNNFQLGDVRKGNVIAGFFYPFLVNDDDVAESSGAIIKSNMLSIQSDGLTVALDYAPAINNVYGNVIVGGTAQEGNLFAKGMRIQPHQTNFCKVDFSNNYSGTDYYLANTFASSIASFGEETGKTSNSEISIHDNVFATNGMNVPFIVTSLGGTVNIIRNYINVDRSLKKLGLAFTGVYVQICKEVHIGDNDVADANYIGYCRPIFAENTGNLTFTKNSFFCTTNNRIYFDNYGQQRTQCNLTQMSANSVSGTATPYSSVELFYTDKCKTCSAQTYFATVNADAAGTWSYNGALSGTVVACATYDNMSSEFTYTHINTDNIEVNSACGGLGSITGIQVFGATNIKWVDKAGNVVGNTADLLNLKPGSYKLLVDNGGCSDTAGYFTILPKFVLDTSKVVITNPTCGNSLGSITGLSLTNNDNGRITLKWRNAGGDVIGSGLDIHNISAGTYYFSAVGADTCVQNFGPIVLGDQDRVVSPPSVSNMILCVAGTTFLNVNKPIEGYSYNLYDSEDGTIPIARSADGRFKLDINKDETYYVTQAFYDCESTRTMVKIQVALSQSSVPNTFTPNGDGVNDYWSIKGIERFPAAIVQIFTRNGQKVFDSKGYAHPFDGTTSGAQLPGGVYYYIISLSPDCKFGGSLTILR